MRLLDLVTGDFAEFNGPLQAPPYAALSHRWATDEQTYQDVRKIQERCKESCRVSSPRSIWDSDSGLSDKVRGACEAARRDGFRYLWIDSCCIDKTSSSELSESINSMYVWYSRAEVCYTFLADVPTSPSASLWSERSAFRSSEWFTRGWTLQELIAPHKLVFLSQTWELLGTKSGLARLIEEVTGIPLHILTDNDRLLHGQLDRCSVAQRMSWAALRKTTKVEDRAYSLLGIFNIQMPPLYGEGEGAFRRLQEEILRRIPDQTIFAWGNVFPEPFFTRPDSPRPTPFTYIFSEVLAHYPDAFAHSGQVVAIPPNAFYGRLRPYCKLSPQEYTSTPNGIRTDLPLLPLIPGEELFEDKTWRQPKVMAWYLAVLACELSSTGVSGKHLLPCCVYGIPSPFRPVNSMYRSALKDARPSGPQTVGSEPLPSSYSIFRLSWDDIEVWGAMLRAHMVYIGHLARTPLYSYISDLDVTMRGPISFTLPTWSRAALEDKGYNASLEGPSQASEAGVGTQFHRLTLTPDAEPAISDQFIMCRWTIIVDFSAEWTPGGDGDGGEDDLRIRAAVRSAGPRPHDGDHPDTYTHHLQWLHRNKRSSGWHWGLMSGTLMLPVAGEGHERRRLELGVRLASESCYRIHVALGGRGSVHAA
uniref:Peptidylprolyl isomerase (EC) n=1 Tax=Ganoderma boninense TaxID=34458 RepID=A0A5K1K1P1_9APHY|nr:Peptidylprolyl isomerase (EC [Ganoderma boninense]